MGEILAALGSQHGQSVARWLAMLYSLMACIGMGCLLGVTTYQDKAIRKLAAGIVLVAGSGACLYALGAIWFLGGLREMLWLWWIPFIGVYAGYTLHLSVLFRSPWWWPMSVAFGFAAGWLLW